MTGSANQNEADRHGIRMVQDAGYQLKRGPRRFNLFTSVKVVHVNNKQSSQIQIDFQTGYSIQQCDHNKN